MGWHPGGVPRTRIRVIRVKRTEKSGEIQGKLDLVQVSREFSLSEFELLGFYCIYLLTLAFGFLAFLVYFHYPAGNPMFEFAC